MLKLKNISKYYHSNDVVALGLRKVNIEFKLGEFVAVTGESGSGKSTLLNVISGLDTYEDGEMYVNNEETSYFQVEEWESYRRQYIGFVFQNYNIIDSYSVLENVMVALQIQGYDQQKRKERALELIEKVGLTSHVNHKASKLSGGQKQRAVIARALAKDCPIIVADEPTGNLDSESAKVIMELLQEISHDKLVIVVTHNYDEVAEFATRKIRLFDGEIVEDKIIKKRQDVNESVEVPSYFMSFMNLVGISLRNLYRTPRRTIFSLIVGMFIAVFFVFSFGVFQDIVNDSYSSYNNYFRNMTERRIIVNKEDEKAFISTELDNIRAINKVNAILNHDVLMDSNLYVYEEYISTSWDPVTEKYYEVNRVYANQYLFNPASMITKFDLKEGRLPENENEIVVEAQYWTEYTVGQTIKLGLIPVGYEEVSEMPDSAKEVKIVGISNDVSPGSYAQRIFVHEDFITDEVIMEVYALSQTNYLSFSLQVEGIPIAVDDVVEKPVEYYEEFYYGEYPGYYQGLKIVIDNTLENDEILLSKDQLQLFADKLDGVSFEDNPTFYLDEEITVVSYTNYYQIKIDLEIIGTPPTVEVANGEELNVNNTIVMNETTLLKFIDDSEYQISVFVEDSFAAKSVIKELQAQGYNVIYPSGVANPFEKIAALLQTVFFGFVLAFFVVVVWFISYLVLRNVQKAKQKDYLIFRSIGASKKDLNKVTTLELIFTMTIAYILTLILFVINEQFSTFIPHYLKFFTVYSYLAVYFILVVLAVLLSTTFNIRIFKKSVITSLKQE